MLAVIGDAVHAVGAGKGTVFAKDFCGCSFHFAILLVG